jgi:hypothetical protein
MENIINVKSYKEIKFPNELHFAESFVILKDKIYFPLNISADIDDDSNGVYVYDINSKNFNLLFKPENRDVILGSKIYNNKFIGCVTNLDSIIIYDFETKEIEYIKVKGCPNDLCIYDDNIYVIINMNYRVYNGIVKKININTRKSKTLIKNINTVTGINIIDNNLYIATLINVIKYNIITKKIKRIIKNNKIYPFYDNITINNNKLNIAIYNYNQRLYYYYSKYYICLLIINYMVSFFVGIGYYDIINNQRKMDNSKKIKFISYNTINKTYKINKFNININTFDYEITQIEEISENQYLLVNWKANSFVIINKNI